MGNSLTFYTNPQSRGQIARWMLEEVGCEYKTQIVEYGESMKSPEFLAINPMGKVPAIKHGKRVVTECAAICAYLADAFPDAGLAPKPEDRASYYRWLFYAAGPVEAAITNKSLGFDISPDQERMAGYGNYDRVVTVLDSLLRQGPYVTGESFSAADVYLGSHIVWGMEFGTIRPRPAFEEYAKRVQSRDAYQRAQQMDGVDE
ncbi:MAG: glutathione S-transferase family protein [Gammaproteobacteria bacterium]|nr:glutathione S-transferase family protein [Gammaproteobacteria bacterium]MYD81595.1 glutathione S-transferase family protein [Gammaproteobacteria bacterium]